MYNLRYTTPRLCGYVYRRKVRCGKPNCRCAKDDKYRHTAYYLQYRERVNGKWKRRSEYVPKNKIRALRARIKRAKQRDREIRETTRAVLDLANSVAKNLKSNPNDITPLLSLEGLFTEIGALLINILEIFVKRDVITSVGL